MAEVLVTGGTGFIGSHLVDELLRRGYNVRCIVRKTSNLRWLRGKNITIYYSDLLSSIESLEEAIRGVDYVYHIAGVTKGRNYLEYHLGNVRTTLNLLRACSRYNSSKVKKFVLVSSFSAVGPGRGDHPVDEETRCAPITLYGRSKAEAERITLGYAKLLPVTVIRPPAVYGPRDTYTFEILKYIKYGILPIVLPKNAVLSMIYVSDLVDALILAAESDLSNGRVYFVSDDKCYTWRDIELAILNALDREVRTVRIPAPVLYLFTFLSEIFFRLKKKPAPLNFDKLKEVRQSNWFCCTYRAMAELGYRPKVELEEGMRRTIKWYVENKWL